LKNKLAILVLIVAIIAGGIYVLGDKELRQKVRGKNTVASIVHKYGEAARQRLKEHFDKVHLAYPPKSLLMLGLKTEKVLELYGTDESGKLQYICTYPILGNSGVLGPKLKEGDKQMPEGFYRIREFEPNSSYHVALRVDYPSEFDKERGKEDGRVNLGSDIMIHGNNCSIGCLAMGDPASEDLFVLVNDVGLANTELIMSPYDFRRPIPPEAVLPTQPEWIVPLYARLKERILTLPQSNS
jgi:murein L,D-transpeptidase YafK